MQIDCYFMTKMVESTGNKEGICKSMLQRWRWPAQSEVRRWLPALERRQEAAARAKALILGAGGKLVLVAREGRPVLALIFVHRTSSWHIKKYNGLFYINPVSCDPNKKKTVLFWDLKKRFSLENFQLTDSQDLLDQEKQLLLLSKKE